MQFKPKSSLESLVLKSNNFLHLVKHVTTPWICNSNQTRDKSCSSSPRTSANGGLGMRLVAKSWTCSIKTNAFSHFRCKPTHRPGQVCWEIAVLGPLKQGHTVFTALSLICCDINQFHLPGVCRNSQPRMGIFQTHEEKDKEKKTDEKKDTTQSY